MIENAPFPFPFHPNILGALRLRLTRPTVYLFTQSVGNQGKSAEVWQHYMSDRQHRVNPDEITGGDYYPKVQIDAVFARATS